MSEIDDLKKEYESLIQQLSEAEGSSDWEKIEKITKRKNFLEKLISKKEELNDIENKIEENKSIISAGEDSELVTLAEAESIQLAERKKRLEREIDNFLKGESGEGPQSVIIEIRAGTGGEEAALFVGDLFRMYSKYAKSQNWKQKILDSRNTDIGGYKEVILGLEGGDVFSKMKYEGGVHRVQRIPVTEKSGRIHTSTVSVAVLQKPQKAQIQIRPDDLKVDYYRASGPGGQYVNKTESAVRITHLPSGLVVTSQTERSQQQNKANAMAILEARLLDRQINEEEEKTAGKRRSQIGSAKRAEKIRTYNFPQDRLTDHRIKKSWHNLPKIIEGELGPVIEALRKGLQEDA
jgi:peptide chain release factor 1